MYMPYISNPHIPEVRRQAVMKVYNGWSIRQTARHFGVQPSTISRWVEKMPHPGNRIIPTQSSRPHHHPREINEAIVFRILEIRHERNQCAEIVHHRLSQEGIVISLSSVKRILQRNQISKFSKWKKWHSYTPRPLIETAGSLVQIDTIRDGIPADHLCSYSVIDVFSRFAYAEPTQYARAGISAQILCRAQQIAPFRFQTIQSDHGSEFSRYFTKKCSELSIHHRHSRIRTPTDNAYVERFNRTIQEECFARIPRRFSVYQKEIPEYIHYYNYERPHMSLGMKTPMEMLRSY
jgi:transposase InsO family protein